MINISDIEAKLKNVPLEYINPALLEGTNLIPGYEIRWLLGSNQFQAKVEPSDEEYVKYDIYWRAREKAHHILLKAMIKRNVKIVTGCDSDGFLVVPELRINWCRR